ncbi:transglycosylase SLT domain-containing protein [Maritimibacter alkaliphilus]|nr:transglycosylase SLT domain-containing protein [Maritimibacter alkaliphilus]
MIPAGHRRLSLDGLLPGGGVLRCLAFRYLLLWTLVCEGALGGGRLGAQEALLCDHAARQASMESGVPLDVLLAITRTETGRMRAGRIEPWPWTVNMEGKGLWFDTPREAQAYIAERHAEGARSYDVGCFQINYRWHGEAFSSLATMMDPLPNARYAAQFLQELYEETGSWSEAAGAYHSRTRVHATRYRARFDRIRRSVADLAPADVLPRTLASRRGQTPPREISARVNRFPLLQLPPEGHLTSSYGSLVALPANGARPLSAAPRVALLPDRRARP